MRVVVRRAVSIRFDDNFFVHIADGNHDGVLMVCIVRILGKRSVEATDSLSFRSLISEI